MGVLRGSQALQQVHGRALVGGSGGKAQKIFDLSGVILETEGSVLQRYKRALFPYKNL